jgi:hypothetical protein
MKGICRGEVTVEVQSYDILTQNFFLLENRVLPGISLYCLKIDAW